MLVYVDWQLARVNSARGQGFWYWWNRNDLEPLGADDGIADEG